MTLNAIFCIIKQKCRQYYKHFHTLVINQMFHIISLWICRHSDNGKIYVDDDNLALRNAGLDIYMYTL